MNKTTKIPLAALNTDDSDAILPIGSYRSMRNLIPASDGISGSYEKESIKGEVELDNSLLPSGTNKTVGVFSDRDNNLVFYFNYNSNGDHGVYKLAPSTNTITKIIESSLLSFTADTLITGVGVLQDFLIFSDGQGEQISLNISKSYSNPNKHWLYLNRRNPTIKPSDPIRTTDPTISYNNIAKDNFQFSYLFVYDDDAYTKLSPFSKVSVGESQFDYNDNTNNIIQTTIDIPSDIAAVLSKVLVYYRKNGGDWYKFEEFDIQGYFEDNGFYPADTTVTFDNLEAGTILGEDDYEFNNSIPVKSECLAINKNLVFLTSNEEGRTLETSTASMTASVTTDPISSKVKRPYQKLGGTKEYGIVYYDKFGQVSQVDATVRHNTPYIYNSIDPLEIPSFTRPQVQLELSGKPPVWAEKYSIVRTRDLAYEQYMQIPVMVNFFVGEIGEDDSSADILISTEQYYKAGNYLFREKTPTDRDQYSSLFLQMPRELPFVPTTDYYVRLRTLFDTNQKVEKVRNVIGNWIEVDNFGINWKNFESSDAFYSIGDGFGWFIAVIEVFLPKDSEETVYFEDTLSGVYDVTNPGDDSRAFSVTNIKLGGDTFHSDRSGELQFNFDKQTLTGGNVYMDHSSTPNGMSVEAIVETPVWVTKQTDAREGFENEAAEVLFGRDLEFPELKTSYTFDYSKITENFGRTSVEIPDARILNKENTIRWSNPYIQSGSLFGLNTFNALDQEDIPTDRSKITKLQPVGQLMLAIHERCVTTLFVNENVITTADGQPQITKSDNILGYNRESQGDYGTEHPETVVEKDGKVYWFDVNNAEICRYSAAGVTPLSRTYKAKKELLAISKEVKDRGLLLSAGFDPLRQIYYLTAQGQSGYTDLVLDDNNDLDGSIPRIDLSSLDDAENYELTLTWTAAGRELAPKEFTVVDQDGTTRALFSIFTGESQTISIDYNDYDYIDIQYSGGANGSINTKVFGFEADPYSKTIAFHDKDTQEKFIGFFDFFPEYYCHINNKLYCFKDGKAYEMYQGDHATFFGTKYPLEIQLLHNEDWSKNKVYAGIAIESSNKWEVVSAVTPDGKDTELSVDDFVEHDESDSFFADFLRDKNTLPDLLGVGQVALIHGDQMEGKQLLVTLKNNETGEIRITHVNISYLYSDGHLQV